MRRRFGPLPPSLPLRELLRFTRSAQPLGVWFGGRRRWTRMVARGPRGAARLVFSHDLVRLLDGAERVLAWDGSRLRRLAGGAGPAQPRDPPHD